MLNPNDYTELAILAALNELDERDEDLLADSEESRDWQDTLHSLPYAEELLPIPENLKNRLLDRLNAQESPSYAIRESQQKWRRHPLAVGIYYAPLRIDRVTRQQVVMLRCEPSSSFPSHEHAEYEEILVIEGDVVENGETYGKGDYIYSSKDSSHELISQGGCLLMIRTSLDDRYPQSVPRR